MTALDMSLYMLFALSDSFWDVSACARRRRYTTTHRPAFRLRYCSCIQAYVALKPASRVVLGSQFSTCLINELSLLRPATPRGAVRSYLRSSFTPAIFSTLLTSSLTETNSLDP